MYEQLRTTAGLKTASAAGDAKKNYEGPATLATLKVPVQQNFVEHFLLHCKDHLK